MYLNCSCQQFTNNFNGWYLFSWPHGGDGEEFPCEANNLRELPKQKWYLPNMLSNHTKMWFYGVGGLGLHPGWCGCWAALAPCVRQLLTVLSLPAFNHVHVNLLKWDGLWLICAFSARPGYKFPTVSSEILSEFNS